MTKDGFPLDGIFRAEHNFRGNYSHGDIGVVGRKENLRIDVVGIHLNANSSFCACAHKVLVTSSADDALESTDFTSSSNTAEKGILTTKKR